MIRQAIVTDPVLFDLLHAVRSTANRLGYSGSVLRCGCMTVLHELDMDKSPDEALALAVLAMSSRVRVTNPEAML